MSFCDRPFDARSARPSLVRKPLETTGDNMIISSKSVAPVKLLLVVVLLLTGSATAVSESDPVAGTWELDVLHSTFHPGPAPKSEVRTYAETADGVKVSIKAVDANGKTQTTEYPINFNSTDYVGPDTKPGDAVALTKDNDYHASAILKHANKIMANVDRTISEDGKSMIITYTGTNAAGDKVHNISIYRKVNR
jgi:hypothetical protein